MTIRSLALAPLAALEAVTPAPRRMVGKGAPAPRPVPVTAATPEPATVQAQATAGHKPVGPTDPLRHAVFLAKTLRRA